MMLSEWFAGPASWNYVVPVGQKGIRVLGFSFASTFGFFFLVLKTCITKTRLW